MYYISPEKYISPVHPVVTQIRGLQYNRNDLGAYLECNSTTIYTEYLRGNTSPYKKCRPFILQYCSRNFSPLARGFWGALQSEIVGRH